jgi:hypothetical protein
MWEQASPYEASGAQKGAEPSCHIYFDKFVEFVRRLFTKWKKLEVSNIVIGGAWRSSTSDIFWFSNTRHLCPS